MKVLCEEREWRQKGERRERCPWKRKPDGEMTMCENGRRCADQKAKTENGEDEVGDLNLEVGSASKFSELCSSMLVRVHKDIKVGCQDYYRAKAVPFWLSG